MADKQPTAPILTPANASQRDGQTAYNQRILKQRDSGMAANTAAKASNNYHDAEKAVAARNTEARARHDASHRNGIGGGK